MVYLLHMELILVIIYSHTPLDAQRVDPVGRLHSSECPCQKGATSVFPNFLGYNDFYCESGLYWHPGGATLYTEPLWDGKNCDWKEAPCCTSS